MRLFDATITAKIATHLYHNRYKLNPVHSTLFSELSHEAELIAPYKAWIDGVVEDGSIGRTPGWQVAISCFWGSLGSKFEFGPVKLRVVLNQPIVAKEAKKVEGRLFCFNEGENSGNISHFIRMGGSRGEHETSHADDLLVYCLNGYDSPEAIADLLGILKIGSTISVAFPTSKHALWLNYFEIAGPDALLDAAAKRFRVEKVFEQLADDFYVQVYGLS